MQAACEFLHLRAVDADQGAEVSLVAQAAGMQLAQVCLGEDAQVALRVGQQRGVAGAAHGIQRILPPLRLQVLRQLQQQVIPLPLTVAARVCGVRCSL